MNWTHNEDGPSQVVFITRLDRYHSDQSVECPAFSRRSVRSISQMNVPTIDHKPVKVGASLSGFSGSKTHKYLHAQHVSWVFAHIVHDLSTSEAEKSGFLTIVMWKTTYTGRALTVWQSLPQ